MTTKIDDRVPTAKQLREQAAMAEAEKAAEAMASTQRQRRKKGICSRPFRSRPYPTRKRFNAVSRSSSVR